MKKKTKLIIAALAALAVLASLAYVFLRPAETDPYESFSRAMDHWVGPGQWSALSHEGSSGNLTVNGLNVKLPPGQGAARPGDLAVDAVHIKKLPRKLAEILADWQNRPGTALAEDLRLEGFSLSQPESLILSPKEARAGDVEWRLEELNLRKAKLAPAPEVKAAEGDFLKALRLGSLDYKNLLLTVTGQEARARTVVESAAFETLSFSGDLPPGLAGPLYAVLPLANMKAKNFKATGLRTDFLGQAPEAPGQVGLSLADLEGVDLAAFKAGALKLADFQIRLIDGEGGEYSLNLAGASLKGLDAADYAGKLMAGLANHNQDNQDEALERLAGQFTLADFFVSPISLTEAALTGLDMDLAGLATLKLAESKASGPYRVGEIPASSKTSVKGLEIKLIGNPEAGPDTPGRDIYELIPLLGRDTLALEAEAESLYKAETGLLTTKLNRLRARELFDLSFSQTWGGLTRDRLEKFKTMPLGSIFLAALDPGGLLGEASFNALNIKFADQGLTDLYFKVKAKEEGGTVEELRQRTLAEAGLLLTIMGPLYIKNPEDLSQPLLGFLKAPQSLEVDLKASPPLTYAVGESLADPMVILDTLNITISANGNAGTPLRFVNLGQAGPMDDDGDDDDDDYLMID
jgi:hypothetical protein